MTLETSALAAAPLVVGVTGGSGSGKSALAARLSDAFGRDQVALLSEDAYYRDRSDLADEERARLDYDVPDAFDHELFVSHLRALRAGLAVAPPSYCFVTHRRTGVGAPTVPRALVIVEGILLLHDPAVRAALDLSVFVEAPDPVRLARRLRRDTTERGRTEASVLSQCRTSVLPAHAAYVEPTKRWADLVLVNVGDLSAVVEVAASLIRGRRARRALETGTLVP